MIVHWRNIYACICAGSLLFSAPCAAWADAPHSEQKKPTRSSHRPKINAETIDVRARRLSLFASDTSVATKTQTPIENIPQNVTVITQARMSMLNSRSVSEAVRYAAGVSDYGSKDDNRGFQGTIRGFASDSYLDGTRTPDAASFQSFSIEPWGLEELDVLRGANAALYGGGQLGGIINAVSKRPHVDQRDEVQIQTGSYDRIQGAADLGGPLNGSKTLLWRLNGLIRKSNSYAKNIINNEIYVAPSLRWMPTEKTDFTILASFEQVDLNSSAQNLPAQGTVLPDKYGQIARNFLSGDENFDLYSKRQAAIGYAFTQHLLPNWTLTQNMRFAHLDVNDRILRATSFLPDQRTLARSAQAQSGTFNNVTLDTRSDLHLTTAGIHHDFIFGVDFRSDFVSKRIGSGRAPSLDVFDPVYLPVGPAGYGNRTNTNETETQTGIYAQEQADWHRFFLTLSGRGDFTQSLTVNNANQMRTPQKNNAFTGRVGLLYQSRIGLAPYVNYSTSFEPEVGTTQDNTPFVPTRGSQIEAGVKYRPTNSFLGNHFMMTADYFDLVEHNVLTPDPTNTLYDIQIGVQRTHGFEFEAVGQIFYKINVLASFTWQDPKITRTTVAAQLGQRPVSIPAHMASLFLERDVRLSEHIRSGIGAGVRYTGNTAGALPATFLVPSQLVWDLQAHVDFHRFRVQFNGTNIANRKYVAICQSAVACAWAPGRSAFVTLSYHW